MKRTLLRKIAFAALSVCTAMSMGMTAFAADLTNGTADTNEVSLNISKVLTVKNPNLTSVDGPGASYSYQIQPVTPSQDNGGTGVSDSSENAGTVHAGPADGVLLTASSVSFPVGTAVDASSEGAANTKYLTARVDISKFTSPGIYRYSITETPELGSTGVTDTGDRVRYLDVYIVNGTDSLEVSGFTLHDKYNNKTDGFNGGSSGSGSPFTGAAEFETVNITLSNEVTGNMADKSNQFPFTAGIGDSGRYFYASKGSLPEAAQGNLVQGNNQGSSVSTTLSDGEVYYISGISKTALVSYTETNNTSDTYQVEIVGGNSQASTAVDPNGTKAMTEAAVTESGTVTFKNSLSAVSPTGVVMRYGAPLMVLLFGALMILLGRKDERTAEN